MTIHSIVDDTSPRHNHERRTPGRALSLEEVVVVVDVDVLAEQFSWTTMVVAKANESQVAGEINGLTVHAVTFAVVFQPTDIYEYE